MARSAEQKAAGPSFGMRVIAGIVLAVAAWVLLKIVIGIVTAVAIPIALVLLVVAIVWAWRTLF